MMELKEKQIIVRKFMVLAIDKKNVQGYSFCNQYGNCMIIVYGENKKKSLINFYSKTRELIEC
jgi:hypothetical protein